MDWDGTKKEHLRDGDRATGEPGPRLVVIPIYYGENAKLTQRLGKIGMRVSAFHRAAA